MKGTEKARAEVIEGLLAGRLTYKEAARLLSCCRRTIERCAARYRARGAEGLRHGLEGKRSNRAKPAALCAQITSLYQESSSHLSLAAFVRYIERTCGIRLSRETLRLWLIAAGLRAARPAPSQSSPELTLQVAQSCEHL